MGYLTELKYKPYGGLTGPHAVLFFADNACSTSSGDQAPAPTLSSVPTKLLTWLCKKLRALIVNRISVPLFMGISVTNNSSRVLTGLVAWHIDDLKVVKSWLPNK